MNSPILSGRQVLLVDDDPLVQRIYTQGLTKLGLTVTSAADGLEAIKALRAARPDVVVLDLMMPKFSGAEVLKFIHAEPALASLPVVVLSNVVTPENVEAPGIPGPQRALLKYRCTPAILAETLRAVIEGQKVASPPAPPPAPAPVPGAPNSAQPAPPGPPAVSPSSPTTASQDTELLSAAREDFLRKADSTCLSLRSLHRAWDEARNEKDCELKLRDFHRRIHFLSAEAGLAQCCRIALLSGVLEALLFQLMDQRGRAFGSLRAAVVDAMDCLEQLVRSASSAQPESMPRPRLLVLHRDAAFNRSIVWALKQLGLEARGATGLTTAWQSLGQEHFDLVLLDDAMPGLDSAKFAERLRALPGYQGAPVLVLSARNEPGQPAGSTSAGALLARPTLPTQIALQAITRLLGTL
jgi:CheY-like chemotaxis protein